MKNNVIQIEKSIFIKDVILFTCSVFLSDAYFDISDKDDYFIISIDLKDINSDTLDNFKKKFKNELILQQTKNDISNKFSEMNSIILEAAFAPMKS